MFTLQEQINYLLLDFHARAKKANNNYWYSLGCYRDYLTFQYYRRVGWAIRGAGGYKKVLKLRIVKRRLGFILPSYCFGAPMFTFISKRRFVCKDIKLQYGID